MSCLDFSLVQTLGPRLLLWLRPKETGRVPTVQTRLLFSQSQEWSYVGASSLVLHPSNQHQRQWVTGRGWRLPTHCPSRDSSSGQEPEDRRPRVPGCICLGWSCYCAEQREEKHVSRGGLWWRGWDVSVPTSRAYFHFSY